MKKNNFVQQMLHGSICNGKVLPDHMQNGLFINFKTELFMKNIFFRLVIIFLIISIPLMMTTSCISDESTGGFDGVISDQKLAISDSQVKKEIDFLYANHSISNETYERWLTLSKEQLFRQYDKEENGEIVKVQYYSYSYQGSTDGFMFERKFIQKAMADAKNSILQPQNHNRMKRTEYMYDAGNGSKTIVCRLFKQDGNNLKKVTVQWELALKNAITEWNNLGLKVKFSTANATNTNIVGGYVNIFMDYWDHTLPNAPTWATASPPSTPGYFGEILVINTSTSITDPSQDAKKRIMVHELGHIVGFHHTNASLSNGNSDVFDNVYNTGVTCNESIFNKSIMHSEQKWNDGFNSKGFTSCDKKNFKYYWGY